MNSPGIYPGVARQDRSISPPFENVSKRGNGSQGGAGEGLRIGRLDDWTIFDLICYGEFITE